jgi:cytochrome b561
MSLKNTHLSYGKLSIGLHWLMALMVMGMICIGFFMGTLEKGPEKVQIIQMHKATGFVILLLSLFRWYWTLTNEKVSALPNWSKRDIGISHGVKWMLMLMLLIMPVSGWVMSMAGGRGIDFYGLFQIPAFIEKSETLGDFFHDVHEIGARVIAALVTLHILAALRHHFFIKDKTLTRMLGRD